MLTDTLFDMTPDVYSDHMNFLIVYPTEVSLVQEEERRQRLGYLRNMTPHSLVSARG